MTRYSIGIDEAGDFTEIYRDFKKTIERIEETKCNILELERDLTSKKRSLEILAESKRDLSKKLEKFEK